MVPLASYVEARRLRERPSSSDGDDNAPPPASRQRIEVIGGSADLTPSNNTLLKCSGDYQKATPGGRYLRFGVREHGMSSICNGIVAHGGLIPYCATFLNFMGYAFGASSR